MPSIAFVRSELKRQRFSICLPVPNLGVLLTGPRQASPFVCPGAMTSDRTPAGWRLILTGVRPSGLRPNTGPNGPGTLVSPSGTDRKLLYGPGSDVNWTSRRPVPSARPVSDTGRSADQAREGHFYRGICDRYVRRSQSVVTHMGYCLRLECERSGVPLRKIQQNGQPIAGRVVVSRWLSALNFLILLMS